MSDREPSQRQLRVGEQIRHALSRVLARGELRDPALNDVSITVSEVRCSPDLKLAKVFVLPLGGRNTEEVLAALRRAGAFLRGQVAREVRLKYTPGLRFLADESFEEASRIDKVLRRPEVARDLRPGAANDPAEDGDPDGGTEDRAEDRDTSRQDLFTARGRDR
jgi:ribosome-binding factor A